MSNTIHLQSETNLAYWNALRKLYDSSIEVSPRGMKVKEILAYKFNMDPRDKIIHIEGFETNEKYAKEELAWYYSGSNKINFSPMIEKTWKRFSDDGKHANSAYGHRIFGNHTFAFVNQWEWVKKELSKDKDSRRAVINLNFPSDKVSETKDFVCTMYLQFFIRNDKLYMITNMRSQDIYFGTRNDIYCFMSMQTRLAEELGVALGTYQHFCGSLHIYEQHFHKLNKLFGRVKDEQT